MSTFKKILSLICVLALVLSMAAGCNNDTKDPTDPTDPSQPTSGNSGTQNKTNYTISLKSAGGVALSGVTVLAYGDEALQDLQGYGQTDSSGQAVLSLAGGKTYYMTLTNVPDGYVTETYYVHKGGKLDLTLSSQVIADSNLAGVSYKLGDVMRDFTVTAADGNSYTLSEMLKEKDAVVLNFWYTTCTYCIQEFPYLDTAYQNYSDKIGVLALNNYAGDKPADVEYIQNSFYEYYNSSYGSIDRTGGLPFPMCYEELGIGNAFNLSGYPTTVVVDRYGVICFIYAGGLPNENYWGYIFDAFIGEDYTQTLYTDISQLIPEAKPTEKMPASEEIDAAFSGSDMQVTYCGEEGTEDAEYSWPFLIGEKDGVSCVYPSNIGVESSYATMYANVTLEKGDVLAFDYYSSSELNADVLYVLVDRNDIYQISGEGNGWNTCYTWVAPEAGEYEVAFCYLKDSSSNVGDDTVYLSNLRVCSVADIDLPTYIKRECATNMRDDGFGYENYATVVLNEKDGYYHVGSENGPLLMANLMMATQFSNDPIYTLAYNGLIVLDGYDYYNDLVNYCSYASNSQIYSLVAVNQELRELLEKVSEAVGIEKSKNEWLQMCCYYDAYGTGGVQMSDPTAGLAAHNAFTANLGKNTVFYDRVIMPRGLLYSFVPEKSGVYRITSHSDTYINGWLFTEEDLIDREPFYTYWLNERAWQDEMNISMVVYLEAGKEYFVDVAFMDVYSTGSIDFTIEYEGSKLDLLVLASPGFFTYHDETTYDVVAGGIDVALGDDGYYHELRADGTLGSILYADFVSYSNIFASQSILDLIASGSFNFALTEDDHWVLDYYDYLEERDFDGTDFETCMKEIWGEDFEEKWELLAVEDVLAGYYHGDGEDRTELMQGYADMIIKSGALEGCVAVDEELAQALQELMDKYTFQDVDHSWTKLCYYYQHFGPEN